MERSPKSLQRRTLATSPQFGVSFSIKQCRHFGIDPKATLQWLLHEAGFRRVRLMSYWNEHEKEQGTYDFSQLDWQVRLAEQTGAVVSLCLGARQPRWPENHWPKWTWELPKAERTKALLAYITAVVTRYKGYACIQSYQLENEALLAAFGERPELDRRRLVVEFNLVKKLDPKRPIIMTTSTSWGIPVRKPTPDVVGFSFYRILHSQGRYHHALHFPRLDRLRARLIRMARGKPTFIHELQLEPWGPKNIWDMDAAEQDKSMSPAHIKINIALARKTNLYPIDLWGGEWWYWRLTKQKDPSIWQTVHDNLRF